ncbi:DMT family transporter [Rubrivivax sp. RP6-9]|uniref:DMT family transporter n=1 Tax=Rubrivivax sp. RP6-9 TaxID=3415750 RepID=UPI003CC54B96
MTAAAATPRAFAALLLLATLFGANHVAARVAMDHGVDVATAVTVRSLATAAVVALLVRAAGVPWHLGPRHRRFMPLIGVLVTVQSLCLYAAVARIPVALALLAFNTYPLWTALAARVFYGHRPERRVLLAMPLILAGLALALDVSGAAGGLGLQAQWGRIGLGVAFAVAAAAVFGLVLAFTQHEVADLDGRLRTVIAMAITGTLALGIALAQGGLHWPAAAPGWWGLLALTALYGTAITVLFTVLPRLGVVGSSPILNVEPVAALLLAWWLLDQRIAPVQVLGALLVVGTVMALGLRRQR